MLILILLLLSLVRSDIHSSSQNVDAFLNILDLKLSREFRKAQQSLHFLKSVHLQNLKVSLISSLKEEIPSRKIRDFHHLMHTWKSICEHTIPSWIKSIIVIPGHDTRLHAPQRKLAKRQGLGERAEDGKFLKFVSIVGVVGLTVGYMIAVSVLALSGLAGMAYTLSFAKVK
jgi:hypothetical protein